MLKKATKNNDTQTVSECDRESLIEDLPKKIRPIFDKVKSRMNGLYENLFAVYYEVGELVVQARSLFVLHSTHPRSEIHEWFADALGVSPRLLHDCARMARMVPQQDYKRLARLPLTWSHLLVLLNKGLPIDEWEHWIKRAIDEQLSVTELQDELFPGVVNRRPGSGRSPTVPANAKQAMARLGRLTTTFLNTTQQAIFSREFDLA